MGAMNPTGRRALVMATTAGFILPVEALADCVELEQLQGA